MYEALHIKAILKERRHKLKESIININNIKSVMLLLLTILNSTMSLSQVPEVVLSLSDNLPLRNRPVSLVPLHPGHLLNVRHVAEDPTLTQVQLTIALLVLFLEEAAQGALLETTHLEGSY